MQLKPGDVIIVASKKGWLGTAILAVLNFAQKDEVKYHHAMLMIDDEVCIEALNKITCSYVRERIKSFKRYKIIRHKELTDEHRNRIAKRAKSLNGMTYGYIRLALQLLDQAFRTNWFTRRIKDPDYQICSSLVAWAYDVETGVRFNNLSWSAVEPDDIDDESLRAGTKFEKVLEWEI